MFSFGNDVLGLGNLVSAIKGENIVIAENQNTAILEAEKIKQAAKTKQIMYMIIGGVVIILIIFLATRKN